MLETYGVPFPVDNSSLDTEDTEESDWWKRGPGEQLSLALPPGHATGAPQVSRMKNRVEWYPVQTEEKNRKILEA
jgi:hypothetical protein